MNQSPEGGSCSALDEVCRVVIKLLGASSVPPRWIKVHSGDAAVEVELPSLGLPAQQSGTGGPAAAGQPDEEPGTGRHQIRAPLVGTFYRAPEPGGQPFVTVGDLVEAGQDVGIIEAMKLMNRVSSEIRGYVVEIPVTDAESVEFDQPLVVVEPAEAS